MDASTRPHDGLATPAGSGTRRVANIFLAGPVRARRSRHSFDAPAPPSKIGFERLDERVHRPVATDLDARQVQQIAARGNAARVRAESDAVATFGGQALHALVGAAKWCGKTMRRDPEPFSQHCAGPQQF